jgi:hypothetical protein
MSLPKNLKSKYSLRFDELIDEGERIYKDIKTEHKTYRNAYNSYGENVVRTSHHIDWSRFVKWRTNVTTLLCIVVPKQNVHYAIATDFPQLSNTKDHLEYGISQLKAIKEDFENGMLESLADQLEPANLAEYMNQAAQFIEESVRGKCEYISAAVLAGAALERALKGLRQKNNPPILIVDNKNMPRRLNSLIDELKKADIFNELVAKQLRAWADIRNNAAHGDFENFKKSDVDLMLKGINSFLAEYVK